MCQAAEAGAQCAATAMPVKRSKARLRVRGEREKPKTPRPSVTGAEKERTRYRNIFPMKTIVRFQSFPSAPGGPDAKLTYTAREGVRQRRNQRRAPPPAGVSALNDVTRERGERPIRGHPLIPETCPDLGASRRRQISSRCSSRSLTYRDSNRILDCRKMSHDQRDH